MASASPPPIHIAATPFLKSLCLRALINETKILAPEAPIG